MEVTKRFGKEEERPTREGQKSWINGGAGQGARKTILEWQHNKQPLGKAGKSLTEVMQQASRKIGCKGGARVLLGLCAPMRVRSERMPASVCVLVHIRG